MPLLLYDYFTTALILLNDVLVRLFYHQSSSVIIFPYRLIFREILLTLIPLQVLAGTQYFVLAKSSSASTTSSSSISSSASTTSTSTISSSSSSTCSSSLNGPESWRNKTIEKDDRDGNKKNESINVNIDSNTGYNGKKNSDDADNEASSHNGYAIPQGKDRHLCLPLNEDECDDSGVQKEKGEKAGLKEKLKWIIAKQHASTL